MTKRRNTYLAAARKSNGKAQTTLDWILLCCPNGDATGVLARGKGVKLLIHPPIETPALGLARGGVVRYCLCEAEKEPGKELLRGLLRQVGQALCRVEILDLETRHGSQLFFLPWMRNGGDLTLLAGIDVCRSGPVQALMRLEHRVADEPESDAALDILDEECPVVAESEQTGARGTDSRDRRALREQTGWRQGRVSANPSPQDVEF